MGTIASQRQRRRKVSRREEDLEILMRVAASLACIEVSNRRIIELIGGLSLFPASLAISHRAKRTAKKGRRR